MRKDSNGLAQIFELRGASSHGRGYAAPGEVRMLRWLGVLLVVLSVSWWMAQPADLGPSLPLSAPVPTFDVGRVISSVRHAFREVGDGWEGTAQGVVSRVEDGRLSVRATKSLVTEAGLVSFETSRVTQGGVLLTPARGDTSKEAPGRLAVDRGAVRERFSNGPEGLEQSWEFPRGVDASKPLEVRVPLREGRFVATTGTGLHFAGGALSLRYGHGTWIDATGARWAVPATWSGSEVVLSVPADVLGRTTWPAVLDPLVSPEVAVDQPILVPSVGAGGKPQVAFNGSSWLVAWPELGSIMLARVDSSGTSLDPTGIQVAPPLNEAFGEVALASDGTGFLLVAQVDDGFGNAGLASIPVSGAGVPGVLASVQGSPPNHYAPRLSWNGSSYLLAYDWDSVEVRALRLTAAGVPIGTPLTVGTIFSGPPAVSTNGTNWLVTWGCWSGTAGELCGRRISATGSLLDAAPFFISTADGGQANPSVGWSGTDWFVAWSDTRSGQADVYGARVSSAGSVLDPAGIPIRVTPGNAEGDLTVDPGSNGVLVTWKDGPSGGPYAIVATRVSSAGVVLDPAGLVLKTAAMPRLFPHAAWDGTNWLVVWIDEVLVGQREILSARVSGAGVVLDTPPRLLSQETNAESRPALAWNGSHYLVVWEDSRNAASAGDLYGVRVTANGTPQDSTAFVISDAPRLQDAPAVASNGSDWLVAWLDRRDAGASVDIIAARVSAAGVVRDPAGIPVRTTLNAQEAPDVASDGADFMVVWAEPALSGTSGLDIYRARVGANGTVLSTASVLSNATGIQRAPAITFGAGNYLVAWEDGRTGDYDVRLSRLTPLGTLVVSEAQVVVGAQTAPQRTPALASDGTRFLLQWLDLRTGSNELYARFLTAPDAGSISSQPEFLLATGPNSGAIASDGRDFLAVYQSGGLMGLRLTPDGGTLGPVAIGLGQQPALASAGPRTWLAAYQRVPAGLPRTRVFTRVIGNEPPQGTAGAATTPEEQPVQVTLAGGDADLDSLTFAVATMPVHGTLTGTPPTLTFTPELNYAGADSFTFTANDGLATSVPATVSLTVTPVNDGPTATAQSLSTPEDTALSIRLGGLDADGDPLTAAVVTPPQHGTLSGAAPMVLYTPQAGYVGADSFTFTVSDGPLTSTAATISLTVVAVSDAPVATPQALSTAEDTSLTITLGGTDADADPLTFSVATPPQHGQLSGTPPSLVYTPEPNYAGDDAFTFTANDGTTDSAAATVSLTVTPVNDAPTAEALSVGTPPGTPVEVTLRGADLEGDALTFSVVRQPEGGTLDGTAPALTFTPADGVSGVVTFTYAASDGVSSSEPALVTITVAEPSPTPANPAELNGWSCGCGSTGVDATLWAALLVGFSLLRQRRSTAACVALLGLSLLSAPAVAADRRTVAVPVVEVTAKDAACDADSVTNMMTAALDRAGVFRVITSRDIGALLGVERQKQLLGCGDDTGCSVELASALGTDLLLQGSVGKVGATFVITARLLDTKDSRVVGRGTVQVASLDLVLEAAWKVTQEALDAYAATRPEAEARSLAQRPREDVPPELVQSGRTRALRFGLAALAVGGWQPLAPWGARLSLGAEVLVTFRVRRFDLSASLVVSPNPGARLAASFALLAERHRLGVGLRATAFPGAGVFGGGPFVGYELGLGDFFGLTATVASEFYGGRGEVLMSVLGGLGVVGRY